MATFSADMYAVLVKLLETTRQIAVLTAGYYCAYLPLWYFDLRRLQGLILSPSSSQ